MIELKLAYPPSANGLWSRTRRGMRLSDKYEAWLLQARLDIKMQRQMALCGHYSLSVDATKPDKRKRDLDNLIKPINDALVHSGVVRDDSDCQTITAQWVLGAPGVVVRIEAA